VSLLEEATRSRTIVVGSGIAGLTAALELGDATVVTSGELGAGASRLAQGGIAAALSPDDGPDLHAGDTLSVAADLADRSVADLVAAAAPGRIAWLEAHGVRFDRDGAGHLRLGQEAGHGRARIVHADGDATGAAVMRVLCAGVALRDDLEVVEHTRAIDLIRTDGRVVGVLVEGPSGRRALLADAVVLATGGCGRVYARTTNPVTATGDGLAMAARVGARLRDLEFVQFHPTALDAPNDPLPLLTEALRGAGATLIDERGHRYLAAVHPDGELAPRDVVARANWAERERGPIYLDARAIGDDLPDRFPTAFAHAQAMDLDPRVDPLPVTPAQHFHMGGVATDVAGRTSIPGLYACGEVAATGLHGGNRLASNSLLEGLVLGQRVARSILAEAATGGVLRGGDATIPRFDGPGRDPDEVTPAIEQVRRSMWTDGGLVRDEAGLLDALATVARCDVVLASDPVGRNLATVGQLILTAALRRRASRGGHWRTDHPGPGRATSSYLTPAPAPTVALDAAPTRAYQPV
jgi:L-aspartate oxidase